MRLLTLLTVIACSFLAGCQSTGGKRTITLPLLPAWEAPSDAQVIDQFQIRHEIFTKIGIIPVHMSDTAYTKVNHTWFEGTLPWSFEVLALLGWKYTENSGDCEDYAIAFSWAISSAARRQGIKLAPLVARIVVEPVKSFGGVQGAPGSRHELIGVCTDRGLFVMEPQPNGQGHPRLIALANYPNKILSVVLGDYNP